MKKFYFVLLFGAFLILITNCSPKEKTKESGSIPTTDLPSEISSESLIQGEKVYNMFCLICHGEDGTMQQTGNYDLAKSTLDLDAIIAVTRQGRGTMMPYQSILNVEDLRAVSEYTLQLQTK